MSYEVPLRDSGPVRSMTGAYPWRIAKGYRTIAYLTNITDQETEFIAEINYKGGKFTLAPRKLQAGETAVFDLTKIRDGQMKWDEVNQWRLALHREFEDAFRGTRLPDDPNYAAANALLVKARRSTLLGEAT